MYVSIENPPDKILTVRHEDGIKPFNIHCELFLAKLCFFTNMAAIWLRSQFSHRLYVLLSGDVFGKQSFPRINIPHSKLNK